MTEERESAKPLNQERSAQTRLAVASWFIIAATLIGLLSVLILIYDVLYTLIGK